MIHIVLDAMGGDFAPEATVKGALLAISMFDVKVTLVGPESIILDQLKLNGASLSPRLCIKHATEVVGMAESPSQSYRKKKDSSLRVGLELVNSKEADAFVSAGNTGAVMTTSLFTLGRLTHVERPGLACILPSAQNPFVMLDMGSSVDCKPRHLVQFAIMGNHFSKAILGVNTPRVGLLNIGEEKDKGNQLTQETFPLLESLNLNFIGYIEGREITNGDADVVVCDGFVGNNILKFGEGISRLFVNFFKKEAKSGSLLSLLGLLFLRPAFKRFKKKFDPDEHGGGYLLGLNGMSVVAHGSAGPLAIQNAIRIAIVGVEQNIVGKIQTAIDAEYDAFTHNADHDNTAEPPPSESVS